MAKQSKKQIIAEAFEILTAPGGTCDPYADNIGIGGTGAELKMRESIWYVLTDLVAEDSFSSHPVLSSAEEIVDAFQQIFNRFDKDGVIDLRMFPGDEYLEKFIK